MTVLRQEQIVIVDQVIAAGGLSGRADAHALDVTEGALRYRRTRLASGAVDGRAQQPIALAGFEGAVAALVAARAGGAPRRDPTRHAGPARLARLAR
jgi:hypothetical protein